MKSLNNYTVSGIDISPVKHLRLSFDNTLEKLEKIVDFVSIFTLKQRLIVPSLELRLAKVLREKFSDSVLKKGL